jgi:hypothetical protein
MIQYTTKLYFSLHYALAIASFAFVFTDPKSAYSNNCYQATKNVSDCFVDTSENPDAETKPESKKVDTSENPDAETKPESKKVDTSENP